MLPSPTAEPVAARMNAQRDDHCPWMEALLDDMSAPQFAILLIGLIVR